MTQVRTYVQQMTKYELISNILLSKHSKTQIFVIRGLKFRRTVGENGKIRLQDFKN